MPSIQGDRNPMAEAKTMVVTMHDYFSQLVRPVIKWTPANPMLD